eukprot:gene25046-33558_t
MAEGDEHVVSFLEEVQDTGYRLCWRTPSLHRARMVLSMLVPSLDLERIQLNDRACSESASIDLNNINSSDEAVSIETFVVKYKNVLGYVAANVSAEAAAVVGNGERILPFHWDKMSTIPGRPHEFLFLLGPSNALLYSAVPARRSTILDDTFTEFIFGSPCVQLLTHPCRITALAVCARGAVLATGDERGCLRLTALSLLDSLPSVQERLAPPSSSSSSSSSIRPPSSSSYLLPRSEGLSLRRTIQAHDGTPVFALAWLATDHLQGGGGGGEQVRWLVSGSMVTLSAARGLQLEAMASLQTASTHILCLHSFSCCSSSSSSRAVFLCAGTNMGTVYVWRLAGPQLASLADRAAAAAAAAADSSLLLGARCLHSHLQSSEDPIIHISMAAAGGPGGEEGRPDLALALLASDNQGGVHLHLASTRPASPAPFFLAASQCFPSAVVGCGFRRTPTPSPLPPRGTQRRTVAGLEETLTQAETTTTMTMTMTAAICLLQGQLVLRCNRPPLLLLLGRASPSPGAGIGVGPGGAAAVRVPVHVPVLPQELLSMQSLGRDILSQLAVGAAGDTRTDRRSQRETGRAFKGQLQGGLAGRDGDGEEEEEEEEEDVLPRTALSVPSPARHWLGSGSPAPPPPPHYAPAPAPPSDRPLPRPVPRGLAAVEEPRGQPRRDAAAPTATDSEVRVAEHREEISRHQRQMGTLTSRSPVAYHDTFCQSHNSYARPALHSSQRLERVLDGLAERIDADNMSVSTVQTTASDRVRAAAAATKSQPALRYRALTSLAFADTETDSAAKARAAAKVSKQVDADWLEKKKRLGPTEQDLRVLSEPDPAVQLRLLLGGGGRGGGAHSDGDGNGNGGDRAGRAAFNRSFGLHRAVHPQSLLPTYALELNQTDIFGSAPDILPQPQPQPQRHPTSLLAAVDQLVDRIGFAATLDRISIS